MFLFRAAYALSIFLTLFICTKTSAQSKSKHFGEQAYMVVKTFEKYHYKPKDINDSFSAKLFVSFINELDPAGLYFTKADLLELNDYKLKLDDEIYTRSAEFLQKATNIYTKKVVLADTIIGELLSKPLDFSTKDSVSFRKKNEEVNYTADDTALKKRWSRWLKYQVLSALFTAVDVNDDPFAKDIKELMQNEPETRKKILAKNKLGIKRILQTAEGFENHIASVYFNEIVEMYDPHSSFFTPAEKQSFEGSISSEVLSFGIYFDENENSEIAVSKLIPGGSAWKTNQLHKGDVLLKIKPANSKIIEVNNTSSYDIYLAVENITAKEAEFTIRKANGQVKTVKLVKTRIKSEENVVKSYILKGEKKIGYISLPSFYTEWEIKNPLGCANDVAKEIVKLQEENIEGLVLDLRFNGGGSVQEAIGLAGLFIDEGPLAIYKTYSGKPFLMKDMNRGTAYNGQLLVLVNGSSASASEIFAAAIQDYNRGVIAGSQTYGKASGQIIIPVDTNLRVNDLGPDSKKEYKYGFVKVTMEKFYRVNNSTHQKKGVAPHIVFPEPYSFYEYRESAYENALANDSINKNVVYSKLPDLPVVQLNAKSSSRIKNNKNFGRLQQIKDSIAYLRDNRKPVILNPQQFKKSEKETSRLTDEMYEQIQDSTEVFKAVNNYYDQKVLVLDDYSKEINTVLLKDIQNDIYIEEAYNIISDLINFDEK